MVAELHPAAELIERARAANSVGRPATAEQLLRRAIRTLSRPEAPIEDQLLRTSATITLASSVFDRHGLEPALTLLDHADTLVPGPRGEGMRTLALVQRAGLLARCGDWDVAVGLLAQITATNTWLTPRQLASVHLNRATAHQYLGDHSRCEQDLRITLELARAAGATDIEFKARHNLGYTRFLTGDVPGALRTMGEADRMNVDVIRATAKRDFARVLINSGLTEEAATLLQDALTIATENRLRHEVGETLVETARLELLRGRPEHAAQAAARAARLFRRRGADGWWVQAEIVRAEAALTTDLAPRTALRLAGRLEGLPVHARTVRRDALLAAAHARLVAGDIERASAQLARVRGPAALPSGKLQHDWLAARLALATGRRDIAQRRLREAARRLAEQQARPASMDTRTAMALHAQRLVTLDVGTALESGSAARVIAATERWRAATSRLPTLLPHRDSDLDTLFTQLRTLRTQLSVNADGPDAHQLIRRVTDLESAIRRREWEVADSDATVLPVRPVRATEITSLAAATDTDVLALFAVGTRLGAVSVDARGMRLHDLGDAEMVAEQNRQLLADVAMAGRRLPGALGSVVRRSLGRRLDGVARLLPIPMTRSRLLVVSTRVLRSLPWRLLPGVDERPLVVAASLTGWARGENHEATADRVAALTGPHLDRGDHEVATVGARWPGRCSVSTAATGADLTDALATNDLVHVAAHGHHHEQNPLFSSVTMADGPLFAYELQRRGVRAGHVILSACDTGRAMIRPGDEAIGLTATLLACGAQSVLAAVAPVDDDIAAHLMAVYHRLLASGVASSAALHRASSELEHPDAARLFATYGADWRLAPSQVTSTATTSVRPRQAAPGEPPAWSSHQ